MDCFCGSGTTLAVASRLDRKWIGVDNSAEAVATILRRFAIGTRRMGDFVSSRNGKREKKEAQMEELPLFDLSGVLEVENKPEEHQVIADFVLWCKKSAATDLFLALGDWKKMVGQSKDDVSVKERQGEYKTKTVKKPRRRSHRRDSKTRR